MKIGENPQRGDSHNLIVTARIFVIIYIPHLTGFFSQMETILNRTLDSLERTVDPKLGKVTLINNASCEEVVEMLRGRKSPVFDQLIFNKTNLGKIDGLISAARGALEEVVVFSDCDVLFMDGWLESVLRVFSAFPEAATVSPIASPRRYVYETRTTLLGAFLRGELFVKARMPISDFERMTDGSSDPAAQMRYTDGQVSISRDGYDVGLSGGHQCVAIRRDVVQSLPSKPCLALLEPHADRDYLDRPADVMGFWRLSTPTMMAFHMGNTSSDWMSSCKLDGPTITPPELPLPKLRKPSIGRIPYLIRRKLAHLVHLRMENRLRRQRSFSAPTSLASDD